MEIRQPEPASPAPRRPLQRLLAAVLVGVLGGLGLFTFDYAEGLSYLSTDPAACANCHIMKSQYDGWQKGSHTAVATCVDCHLPHDFVGKYVAKARERLAPLEGVHAAGLPRADPDQGEATRRSCSATASPATASSRTDCSRAPRRADAVRCVHCHASVGHGEAAGLGGPQRADEIATAAAAAAAAGKDDNT